MYIDALGKVCNGQQVTADAASTYSIDLGAAVRRVGTGEALGFGVVFTAVGTNTGSALVQAIASAAAGLGTNTICGQIDLVAADLVAGKMFFVPIGMDQPILRYLALNFDITGTVDFTVTAWLTSRDLFSVQARSYAKGYNA